MAAAPETPTWWRRPGLEVRDGRLLVAGRDAEGLARSHGTPTFVYDLVRVEEQATALRDVLAGAGLRGVVRLALKAQRDPQVLAFLRGRCPWVGVDVCSPGEVEWALRHGWEAADVSYTGTNVSERDLDVILGAGVHLNVDLLSQLDRVGRRAPGSSLGVRVNPRIGASYRGDRATKYAGGRPTKFGLFAEQLPAALDVAARHGLTIDTVHVHVGDGYLTSALPAFEETIARVAAMVRTLRDAGCPIREVNTGGGLGVPVEPGDEPLDLAAWAEILARHLGPLDVLVGTEPGDFLVKESAVLLAEVVTAEDRDGALFVGLDTGWNQACEHFVYGDRLEIVACAAADAPPVRETTVAGHINEGDDLFAEDRPLPAIAEGDVLAILSVGSYNASMASEHCLRPPAGSVAFADRSGA
ncbi:MAG TPA: diaminopimelate decarboxylase [Actinomycetota bacterium]